jgi:hypothetical protein
VVEAREREADKNVGAPALLRLRLGRAATARQGDALHGFEIEAVPFAECTNWIMIWPCGKHEAM